MMIYFLIEGGLPPPNLEMGTKDIIKSPKLRAPDDSILSHTTRISTPDSVMRKECSNCGDRPPFALTTVQLSFHMTSLMLPIIGIGFAQP
jgi:hypothetical protein